MAGVSWNPCAQAIDQVDGYPELGGVLLAFHAGAESFLEVINLRLAGLLLRGCCLLGIGGLLLLRLERITAGIAYRPIVASGLIL